MTTPSSYPKKDWEKHAKKHFWNKERLNNASQRGNMMARMKKKYEERLA